jgi:hypothetical protein
MTDSLSSVQRIIRSPDSPLTQRTALVAAVVRANRVANAALKDDQRTPFYRQPQTRRPLCHQQTRRRPRRRRRCRRRGCTTTTCANSSSLGSSSPTGAGLDPANGRHRAAVGTRATVRLTAAPCHNPKSMVRRSQSPIASSCVPFASPLGGIMADCHRDGRLTTTRNMIAGQSLSAA